MQPEAQSRRRRRMQRRPVDVPPAQLGEEGTHRRIISYSGGSAQSVDSAPAATQARSALDTASKLNFFAEAVMRVSA